MVVSLVNAQLTSRDLDSTKVECYIHGIGWYVSTCRWNAPYTHDECNALQSLAPPVLHARSVLEKVQRRRLDKLNQTTIHKLPQGSMQKNQVNDTNDQALKAGTRDITNQESDALKRSTRLTKVRHSTNMSAHDRPTVSHVTVSCS